MMESGIILARRSVSDQLDEQLQRNAALAQTLEEAVHTPFTKRRMESNVDTNEGNETRSLHVR